MEYPLSKQYARFKASVSLTEDAMTTDDKGTVEIPVGDQPAQTVNLQANMLPVDLEADITGASKIKFLVTNTEDPDSSGRGCSMHISKSSAAMKGLGSFITSYAWF
ncbi:hypothetical protein PM3016_3469 [Paenibacillus mucilaginosus 3016]|uniref:Glycosyl hydrolase family 98 putative carbohydrate-binding module domain-containing protein n=2 Tax=Paenibacillus mucilaginosus TaxID=61624 RepID=H6NLC0_9BACL|nr:hypothetical protein KNP414_03245 [Paenibacillus mucilaginosus KNP414]AFC30302.1 hypothetical protein PM3016_3469 [Paenibacillus mucilaginosus 3016]MCG7214486.1 hypothetical protein [Paenibacillus mucilaginosus]WDM30768.1 hypothetical protein KCX80_17115 [Paenibacillus mucilaginosus]WFA18943.1 hypothetical protein ERY13_17505 [Paenibacillus mucilaginosus]